MCEDCIYITISDTKLARMRHKSRESLRRSERSWVPPEDWERIWGKEYNWYPNGRPKTEVEEDDDDE